MDLATVWNAPISPTDPAGVVRYPAPALVPPLQAASARQADMVDHVARTYPAATTAVAVRRRCIGFVPEHQKGAGHVHGLVGNARETRIYHARAERVEPQGVDRGFPDHPQPARGGREMVQVETDGVLTKQEDALPDERVKPPEGGMSSWSGFRRVRFNVETARRIATRPSRFGADPPEHRRRSRTTASAPRCRGSCRSRSVRPADGRQRAI